MKATLASFILFLGVLLLATAPPAFATNVKVGPFSLALPPGFIGPVHATNVGADIIAYVHRGKPGTVSDVIEFTRHPVGPPPPGADDKMYGAQDSLYLRQMLEALKLRRTSYTQSPIKRTALAKHVAARATWTGDLDGMPTNGVMYCAIIGTNAWFISAFGPGLTPDVALRTIISELASHPR